MAVSITYDITEIVDRFASEILKNIDYDLWKEEQNDPTGLFDDLAMLLEDFFDEAVMKGEV